jgi:hypothetical protein
MWHGGRDLPPWRWAAGSWRRAALPCRQKCYPAAVPHGGRNLPPWGMAPDVYFSNFSGSTIYFSKIKAKYILKKILVVRHVGSEMLSPWVKLCWSQTHSHRMIVSTPAKIS